MNSTKPRGCLYLITSFIVGLLGAGASFVLLLLFFFSIGLFGWSDGGEKKYLERLEKNTNITLPLSVILAIGAGILIVYLMNKPQRVSNEEEQVNK